MHLTLPAAIAPSLLKLTVPIPPSPHGTAKGFAALLGTLHVDTAPAPELKKKNSAPEQEDPSTAPALSLIPVPTPSKPDVLPLTFSLPTPSPKESSEPASVRTPADPLLQPEPQALPISLPISFLPIGLVPVTLAAPHVQVKAKSEAPYASEPLITPLRLQLKEIPHETPHSEIVFEAKLTPSQPKPAPQAQSIPPTQPEVPRQEVKTPEKPAIPETKQDPTPHAIPTHIADAPTKPIETAPVTIVPAHLERDPAPSRAPETPLPSNASASDLPDLPAPRTEPARDISFRIASPTADSVDVKLVDRAGQIHVAVRSSDPVITQSLQTNIGDLSSKLDRAGFQAETMIPNRADPVQQPQQNSAFQDSQQDRRAPQQEFQQRKRRSAAPTTTFTLNPHQENS